MLSVRSSSFSIIALLCAARLFAADGAVDTSAYKKPIRVACLGDSITYGVGAGTGWGWPDQLDRMLGADWDVRNFGHSGATVGEADKHSIWHQKEYTEAMAFHPDVAIILLGTNDTKPTNWDDAGRKQFPKLYKKLIVEFQQLTSTPRVYCGLPPYVAGKGNFGINEDGVQQQIPIIQEICKDWKAGVSDVVLDGFAGMGALRTTSIPTKTAPR